MISFDVALIVQARKSDIFGILSSLPASICSRESNYLEGGTEFRVGSGETEELNDGIEQLLDALEPIQKKLNKFPSVLLVGAFNDKLSATVTVCNLGKLAAFTTTFTVCVYPCSD